MLAEKSYLVVIRIRKWLACGSWRFSAPPFAVAPMEKIGAAAAVGFRHRGRCTPQPQK
jgi:hypothetical protein